MPSYREMYEKAKKDGGLTDLTPDFFLFDKPGKVITGRYRSSVLVNPPGNVGEAYLNYTFDTDDGLVKFHVGATTDKEIAPLLSIGGVYRIEYKEEIKLQGNKKTKKYLVQQIVGPESGAQSKPDNV